MKTFKEFTALVEEDYQFKGDKNGIARVNVVGVKDNGSRSFRQRKEFQVQKDDRTATVAVVYEDSDESRAALLALSKHQNESARILEQRKKQEDALREKLHKLSAEDYIVKATP